MCNYYCFCTAKMFAWTLFNVKVIRTLPVLFTDCVKAGHCLTMHYVEWWTDGCDKVGTAASYGLDDPGFESRQVRETFSYTKWSRRPFRDTPSLLFEGYLGTYPYWSGRGVKLTTHLHLVPSLRMSGAISPLPVYAFTVWTETILLFYMPIRY
jgi:hypothetical protein